MADQKENPTGDRRRVGIYDRPAKADRHRRHLVAVVVLAIVIALAIWMWPRRVETTQGPTAELTKVNAAERTGVE